MAFVSFLNAPENTPLHQRLKDEGLLREDFDGLWHYSTNIIPAGMPLTELIAGTGELMRRLYEPEKFEKRLADWLSNVSYFTDRYKNSRFNYAKLFKLFYILRFCLLHESAEVRRLFFRVLGATWRVNPRLLKRAVIVMMYYWNFLVFVNDMSSHEVKG